MRDKQTRNAERETRNSAFRIPHSAFALALLFLAGVAHAGIVGLRFFRVEPAATAEPGTWFSADAAGGGNGSLSTPYTISEVIEGTWPSGTTFFMKASGGTNFTHGGTNFVIAPPANTNQALFGIRIP